MPNTASCQLDARVQKIFVSGLRDALFRWGKTSPIVQRRAITAMARFLELHMVRLPVAVREQLANTSQVNSRSKNALDSALPLGAKHD
jgi:hypothetical protein